MSQAILMLAKALQIQKGEGAAMHALQIALLKSLSAQQQAQTFEEFDKQIATLRTVIPSTQEGRDLATGVDMVVRAMEQKRTELGHS